MTQKNVMVDGKYLEGDIVMRIKNCCLLVIIIFSILIIGVLIGVNRKKNVFASLGNIVKFHINELKYCEIIKISNNSLNQPKRCEDKIFVIPEQQVFKFASKFTSLIRENVRKTSDDVFEFIFYYEITFSSENEKWEFQFGYVPHEGYIEFKAYNPVSTGTFFLSYDTSIELEKLISEYLEN